MYPESEPKGEQVEVQDTQVEQQVQPDPPSMKLWKGLKKMDLYSKDYNSFVKQYSDPAEITRLHKGLIERELYSNKDESAFVNQYFPELKKKDQAQVATPSGVGSQVGASQLESTTPTVAQETPKATTEQPLTPSVQAEQPLVADIKALPEVVVGKQQKEAPTENILDAATQYNELKNAKISGGEVSVDVAGDVSIPEDVPDEAKIAEAKKIKDKYPKLNLDEIYEKTKSLTPEDYKLPGYTKEELQDNFINNKPVFDQKINSRIWRRGLQESLNQQSADGSINKEQKNNIISSINGSINNIGSANLSFDDDRKLVQDLSKTIQNFGGQNRFSLLKPLSNDFALTYGNAYNRGFENTYANAPENKYLTPSELLAYYYKKDTNPESAKQYEKLFTDLDNIKDDPNAVRGYDKLKLALNEQSISLRSNAIEEKLNKLSQIAQQNGNKLPDALFQQYEDLKNQKEDLINESEALDEKYFELSTNKKVNEAIQETIGQQFTGLTYTAGRAGEAIVSGAESIGLLLKTPFLSDSERNAEELSLLGEPDPMYSSQATKAVKTEALTMKPELKEQVDKIANDPNLNWNEKRAKLWPLFYQNKNDFGKIPIYNGKVDINPTTVYYSVSDLAASLVPFFLVEAATGGIGGASTMARFLRTANAAITTGFKDVYKNEVAIGSPNPLEKAYAITLINGGAMAGAGTLSNLKALYKNNPVASKILEKMTEAEYKAAVKAYPEVWSKTAQKLNIGKRLQALPGQYLGGAKSGLEFEALMQGAEQAKESLGLTEVNENKTAGLKQAVVNAFIGFPIFHTITAQAGYKTPNELDKSSFLTAGRDPNTYLFEANKSLKNGEITQQQHDEIVTNIKKTSDTVKKIGFVNDKGEPLSEKDQADLLYLKLQESDLTQEINKDLPEPVRKKLGDQILDIKGKVNDIYEGNLVEKEPTSTSVTVGGNLEKGDNIMSKDGRVGKIVDINEKGDAIIVDEKDNLRYRIKAEDIYKETAEQTAAREAEGKTAEETVATTTEVKPTGEEVTTTVEITPEEKAIEERRATAIKEFEANPNLIGIEGKEELITPEGIVTRETINAQFDKEKESLKPTETAPPTQTGASAKVQQLRQRMGLGEATGPKRYTMATIKALDTTPYEGNAKEVASGVKNMMKAVAKLVSKSTGEKLNVSFHDNPESYRKAGGFSSKGFYFGKDGSVHLNMSAVTKDTGAHEFFHPVLDYMAMKRPDIIKNLHDQLKKLDQGAKIVNKNELRYKDRSVETQQKEAITDYIAQVASGQIKLDRTNWEAIRDFIITALDKVGLNLSKDINNITDLQKLAKQITRQFESGQELRGEDLRKKGTIKPEVATGAEFSREDRLNEMAKDDVTQRVIPGKTVSTRLTDAEDIHSNDANFVSLEEQRKAPANYLKNARILAEYDMVAADKKTLKLLEDGIKATLKAGDKALLEKAMLKADEVYNDFIRKAADNLVWLHNHYSPEIREVAKRWYDGANIISQDFGKQYGVTTEQAAGVIAVLSPKKDWYTNVDNAKRIMDIYKNHLDFVITKEMADKYIEIEGVVPPKKKTQSEREYKKIKAKAKAKQNAAKETVKGLIGKKINDPLIRDFMPEMIRTYDETYGDKNFDILSPNGKSLGSARNNPTKAQLKKDANAQGAFTKTSWAGYTAIGKAIRILENGNLENISKELGDAHKVRNFYNNIIDPNSDKGPVTVDTHAGAAAMLKPFAANDTEIAKHTFGGVSDKKTGAIGTYAALTEAYRLAAKEVGILPREMQSITWEAVRGLFTDVFKGGKTKVGEKEVVDANGVKKLEPIFESNKSIIKKIWEDVKNGKLTIDEARTKIEQFAEGIDEPTWTRPGSESSKVEEATPDARELLGSSIVGVDTGEGRGVGELGEAEMVQPTTERVEKPEKFGVGFAPYRERNVNTLEEDAATRDSPEYKLYQQAVDDVSKLLGVEIGTKLDTWGGYIDTETGRPVQEVSNIMQVSGPPSKMTLMAAVLGKIAPQEQNSILLGRYEDGGGVEHNIATGSFENANKALKFLKENDLQYFSIDKNTGDIIILDFDSSAGNNIENFINQLKQNGIEPKHTIQEVNAEFIESQSYDRILSEERGNLGEQDRRDLDAIINATAEGYKKIKEDTGTLFSRGEEGKSELQNFVDEERAAGTSDAEIRATLEEFAKDPQANLDAAKIDELMAAPKVEEAEVTPEPTPKPRPSKKPVYLYEGSGRTSTRGIVDHILDAKNISQKIKKGFENQGAKYEIANNAEARVVAKEIIKGFGKKDALEIAKSFEIHPSVRSAIFAELIDNAYREGKKAKGEDKLLAAKEWAKLVEDYGNLLTQSGQFTAYAGHFYKTSPMGFVMAENDKTQKRFEEFESDKVESFDNLWNQLNKTEGGKLKIEEEVEKLRKAERVTERKKNTKNIDDFFDKMKEKGSSNYGDAGTYFSREQAAQNPAPRIPKDVWDSAMDTMRTSVKDGESVSDAVQKAIDIISESIGDKWNKDKFRSDYQELISRVADGNAKEKPTVDLIKKKIEDLEATIKDYQERIAKGGVPGEKRKEKFSDVEEVKKLIEERDNLRKENQNLVRQSRKSSGEMSKSEEAIQKRIEDLEAELQRVKERRQKEKVEPNTPAEKKITEREKELKEAIQAENEKWDNEIDSARQQAKDYQKLETERNRQIARVTELKKKLDILKQGQLPEGKKTEPKVDTPEIEALKKEIETTEKEVRKNIAHQRKLEGLENELQRLKDRKEKEKDSEKRTEYSDEESALRKQIEDERAAWKVEKNIDKLNEELNRVRARQEKVTDPKQKRELTAEENRIAEEIKAEKKRWAEELAPQKKADADIKRKQARIAELNRRVAEGDFSAEQYKAKKAKDALDIELENAKKLYDQARKQSPEYIKKKAEQFLEQFKERIEGVSEEKKAEMVRRAIKKIIDSGGLEREEFKQIVADVMGFKKLTDEQAAEIEDLNEKINSVSDLEDAMIENPTPENIAAYEAARIEGMDAAMRIFNMTHKEADIAGTLKSLVSGGLLGIPTLIMNVGQNVITNTTIRLPKAVIKQMGDLGIYGVSALMNQFRNTKVFFSPSDLIKAQEGYFKMGKKGLQLGAVNFMKGTQMRDYLSETSYQSTLAPKKAMEDLKLWRAGEKYLTKAEVIDKLIKSSIISKQANFILKGMGFGDLPFRWAAEGATAIQIATKELKLLDPNEIEAFMLSPQKYANKVFIKNGESADVAAQKSEEIKERILNEGKKAVFEEDNLLTMINSGLENLLKTKGESGFTSKVLKPIGSVFKTTQYPFLKIPSNIAWQYFKIMNPELSFSYGAGQLAIAAYYSKKGNVKEARAYYERGKDSFATGILGLGVAVAASSLISAGLVRSSNDEDNKIRETTGERAYGKQNQLNFGKLIGSGDYYIDLKWFGALGSMLNTKAKISEAQLQKKLKVDNTPSNEFVDNLGYSSTSAMNGLVFDQGAKIVDAIKKGNAGASWLASQANTLESMIFGATFTAISKAALPEEVRSKGDGVIDEINNNMKARNIFYRWAAGYPPSRISIWGEPIKKDNSVGGMLGTMFGFQKGSSDLFGAILYDDMKRTGDARFFPMPEDNKITVNEKEVEITQKEKDELDTYVGQYRKALVSSFVYDMGQIDDQDLKFPIFGQKEGGNKSLMKKKYSELNDEQKIEALDLIYKRAKEAGLNQFLSKHQDNPIYKLAKFNPQTDAMKEMSKDLKEASHELFNIKMDKILKQPPKELRTQIKKMGGFN